MKTALAVTLALSLAANVFLGGFVAGRHLGGPAPRGEPREFTRALGWRGHEEFSAASPEARAAIREAFIGDREALREVFKEIRDARRAYGAALSADEWDRAAVEAAQTRLSAAERAREEALSQSFIDAFESLSPEDRKALVKAMDRRGGRMKLRRGHEGREPGPGDGPPPPPQ